MEKEAHEQGKISLMISALISLIVAVLNIKSSHYFYGVVILAIFILISLEIFRKFNNGDF